MNKTVTIRTKTDTYDIKVQNGLRLKIDSFLEKLNIGQKWIIITQQPVADLYYKQISKLLLDSKFDISLLIIPDSENAKSFKTLEYIFAEMLSIGCDRKSAILALGGGVVGDVAGFAAATFMRGIKYVQIPTTLLAMIDSAIGGKTGINLKSGKNLAGAFWHPQVVLTDPEFLKTLPKRQIVSGLGELLKYGLIQDSDLFEKTISNLDLILSQNADEFLEQAIHKSSTIKAHVVNEDEKEAGLRRILNFGHTLGHAIESTFGYDKILHGEAVIYGMIAAAFISNSRGLLSGEKFEYITQSLLKIPLPDISDTNREEILIAVYKDKKMSLGKLNYVLIQDIGKTVIVDDILKDELSGALDFLES